jgi:hypothetical protein
MPREDPPIFICSCIPIHMRRRFPYSWVLPRFRNTLKLMPKRTHSQGNLPYNFIDQTYFSSKLSNHVTWFHDHE